MSRTLPPPPADGARLAIVTVTRNDLSGLLTTRESLRIQLDRDFLWIVVDGASDDGTSAWLSDHRQEIAWCRSTPDHGPYDAMNVGLAAAQRLGAGHVLFLNAGDALAAPGTIGQLRKAAAAAPLAPFLYGDSLERLPDGSLVVKPARSHRMAALGMFTHHQAILYRCGAIGDLRFDLSYRIAADYAFTLSVLRQEGRTAESLCLPVCIFAPAGLSARESALGRAEQRTIRAALLGTGLLTNWAISSLQRMSWILRFLSPEIYKKVRFENCATKFLSLPINHNQ